MTIINPMEFTDTNNKLKLIPNIKDNNLIGITIQTIE